MSKNIAKISIIFILTIIVMPVSSTIGYTNIHNINSYTREPTSPIITGPQLGEPGIEYNFTFFSTDSSGFVLFYYIEWGDGNISEWIGPYESGENITVNHSWQQQGNYTIRAKTNNTNGTQSEWSDDFNITIQPSVKIEIGEIVGGLLGITALINNTGIKNATNVTARVVVKGGVIFIGKDVTNDIGIIEAGNYSGAYNVPVLGFGAIDITISVKCNEVEEVKKTASGFLLFFYIIIH